MFKPISWWPFGQTLVALTIVYYVIVFGWFYKKQLFAIFQRRSSQPIAHAPEVQETQVQEQ